MIKYKKFKIVEYLRRQYSTKHFWKEACCTVPPYQIMKYLVVNSVNKVVTHIQLILKVAVVGVLNVMLSFRELILSCHDDDVLEIVTIDT